MINLFYLNKNNDSTATSSPTNDINDDDNISFMKLHTTGHYHFHWVLF